MKILILNSERETKWRNSLGVVIEGMNLMMIITISFKRPNIIHTTLDLILDIFLFFHSLSRMSMRRKSNLERAKRLQFSLTTFFQFRKVRFNVKRCGSNSPIFIKYTQNKKGVVYKLCPTFQEGKGRRSI